jgi:cell division transport system permease protein
MPVSFEYVSRETASNLWRNRLMTVAAVLTVAVSLFLVGGALLLRQGATHAAEEWQQGTQLKIWMAPTATKAQVDAVGTQLKQLPYVDQPCHYWTQAMDFKEFQQSQPSLVQESQIKASSLPSSWRCTPDPPTAVNQVLDKFRGEPGVFRATAPEKEIHTQQLWINGISIGFAILAVVLLISSGVLILNTIRMAIFARRREVSVMKLVGATNWFIRVPFMSEGMVEGLIGSLVAAGIVYFVHWLLNSLATPGNVLANIALPGWDVFVICVVVVVMGVGVGAVGSAVAIRRFLDV